MLEYSRNQNENFTESQRVVDIAFEMVAIFW